MKKINPPYKYYAPKSFTLERHLFLLSTEFDDISTFLWNIRESVATYIKDHYEES